jgi:hypothetical protein
VAEPKQQNSGIPQGVFLKRHRIPKAGPHTPSSLPPQMPVARTCGFCPLPFVSIVDFS